MNNAVLHALQVKSELAAHFKHLTVFRQDLSRYLIQLSNRAISRSRRHNSVPRPQHLRHSVHRNRLFDERGRGSARDSQIDPVAYRTTSAAGSDVDNLRLQMRGCTGCPICDTDGPYVGVPYWMKVVRVGKALARDWRGQ